LFLISNEQVQQFNIAKKKSSVQKIGDLKFRAKTRRKADFQKT